MKGIKQVVIDIDGTNDPTHGSQQLSMVNGYYGHFMYNELFFHDGETGQIIVPILRPGNSHSNKCYVAILKRILIKIREKYLEIKITIRADSGFCCPAFYNLVDTFNLKYAMGQASNDVLKQRTARAEKAVSHLYVANNIKHQHFISFEYQTKSWHKPQQRYSKIERTGKGLNVRHFTSNMDKNNAREIYFGFYVKHSFYQLTQTTAKVNFYQRSPLNLI